MNYYVDVILPLPLKGTFTYELSQDEFNKLEIGFRVAVSFGKRKIYTGIVNELHNNKPESYETKPCLLYTSPSPRDPKTSRMPSSA